MIATSLLLAAVPALAQTQGGASTGGSQSAIQPAAGGGQVGQPPQNSAMRGRAGAQTGQASAARANPMGMAGMGGGSGGYTANALTLSGGQQGGTQGRGAGQGAAQGQGQDNVRITDTGVTERTPTSQQVGRR